MSFFFLLNPKTAEADRVTGGITYIYDERPRGKKRRRKKLEEEKKRKQKKRKRRLRALTIILKEIT